MSDSGKNVRIKYPDGRYHTIIVTNYLSINKDDNNYLIIFYNDRTVSLDDNNNITYTLIKEDNGVYTHLYCNEDYNSIKNELWPYIYDKKYEVKDINTLPSSIDNVEEYDYYNSDNSINIDNITKDNSIDDNNINSTSNKEVKELISVIFNKIGTYSDPYLKKAYYGIQDDLELKLNIIYNKRKDEWETIKNSINDLISSKIFDMSKGYILFKDVSDFFYEIEKVALKKEENDVEEEVIKNDNKKHIYVIWNKNTNDKLVFLEYNMKTKLYDYYTYNFVNIVKEYRGFIKPLLKYLNSYDLKVENKVLIKPSGEEFGNIALNKNGIAFEFTILPCIEDDLYESLLHTEEVFISTDVKEPIKQLLIKAINKESTLITEDKVYGQD